MFGDPWVRCRRRCLCTLFSGHNLILSDAHPRINKDTIKERKMDWTRACAFISFWPLLGGGCHIIHAKDAHAKRCRDAFFNQKSSRWCQLNIEVALARLWSIVLCTSTLPSCSTATMHLHWIHAESKSVMFNKQRQKKKCECKLSANFWIFSGVG